ncbi:MAG: glycoside hydrolase [Acidobacteriota bacterium]|nr:glycoside hydrolase [Acidobacteriota bacterium]
MMRLIGPLVGFSLAAVLFADEVQKVEGFAAVVFAHNVDHLSQPLDYRGPAIGYATAGWWAPGQMKDNRLVWRTASCPRSAPTIFSFIGASSITPPEFSRGPQANLFVNDKKAITFDLGMIRDRVWREGPYELRYTAHRVEWPYWGSHRQFEMNGDSGLYEFSVPASAIQAGAPVTLKVEMVPFPAWPNGWFMIKNRTDASQENTQTLADQVRQLQRDVARLGELTDVLATQQYSKLIDTRDFEHFVIYTNGYRHLHPADLIPLKNGDILLTAREATEHIAPDGDVIMLRSRDGGKTWGEKQVIGGQPDLDEREGCGVQLRDGTIVVAIFYNSLYRPDGSYEWGWETKVKFGAGKQYLGTYTITSKDNGKTWSKPSFIDTKGMPFSDTEGPADAPVEMPDGSVLMPVMGYNVRGDVKNQASVLLKSTDLGKSWQYFSTIAEDPGNRLGHFQEPALVLTKRGRLIAAMRNDGPEKAIWTSYSDDQGRTWTPAKQSPMIGHPADLIQLGDGRILCTYGTRPGRHADPGGIRATFSSDNGETWQIDKEVQIRRDFLNLDIGYPESLQLADGRILTVYYFNLFGRFFLGGTFWKP